MGLIASGDPSPLDAATAGLPLLGLAPPPMITRSPAPAALAPRPTVLPASVVCLLISSPTPEKTSAAAVKTALRSPSAVKMILVPEVRARLHAAASAGRGSGASGQSGAA